MIQGSFVIFPAAIALDVLIRVARFCFKLHLSNLEGFFSSCLRVLSAFLRQSLQLEVKEACLSDRLKKLGNPFFFPHDLQVKEQLSPSLRAIISVSRNRGVSKPCFRLNSLLLFRDFILLSSEEACTFRQYLHQLDKPEGTLLFGAKELGGNSFLHFEQFFTNHSSNEYRG